MHLSGSERSESLVEALLALTDEGRISWVSENERSYIAEISGDVDSAKLILCRIGHRERNEVFLLKIFNRLTGGHCLWLLLRQLGCPLDQLLNRIGYQELPFDSLGNNYQTWVFNSCNFLTEGLLQQHPEIEALLKTITTFEGWEVYDNGLLRHDISYRFQWNEILGKGVGGTDLGVILSKSNYSGSLCSCYHISLIVIRNEDDDAVYRDLMGLSLDDQRQYWDLYKESVLTFSIVSASAEDLFKKFDDLYRGNVNVFSVQTILDRLAVHYPATPTIITNKIQEIDGKKAYPQAINSFKEKARGVRASEQQKVFDWIKTISMARSE